MSSFHINSSGEVDVDDSYVGTVDDLKREIDDEDYKLVRKWVEVNATIESSLYRVYAWRDPVLGVLGRGVFFEAEYELGEGVIQGRKRWTPKGETLEAIGRRDVQPLIDGMVRRIKRSGYDVFVETDTSIGFRWSVFTRVESAADALKVGGIMERFRQTTDLDKFIVSVM